MAKQKFNLDKGGSKRKFDLHKDLDDEVDAVAGATEETSEAAEEASEAAKSKAEETVTAAKTAVEDVKPVIPETPMVEPERPVRKSNGWLWICIVIAILLAIMAFAFVKCNGNNGGEAVATEQADSAVADADDSLAVPGSEINDGEESFSAEGEAVSPGNTASETSQDAGTNSEEGAVAPAAAAPAPADNAAPATPATPVATGKGRVASPNVSADAPVSSDVYTEALRVIRGDYGVGRERRAKLGDMYSSVQSEVNNLKRQGRF